MSSGPLLRAISALLHQGWAARPLALTRPQSPGSTGPGLVRERWRGAGGGGGQDDGRGDREGQEVPVLVGSGGIVSSLGAGGGENGL